VGPFETSYVVGGGMVTAAAPASRPVSCFTARCAGPPTSQVTFRLSASSTLPGALFAVTPATIVPLPGTATTVARVAIGVPPDARPGAYDVILTALVRGQVRTAGGTLRWSRPRRTPPRPAARPRACG
jgi:hypothetical protein